MPEVRKVTTDQVDERCPVCKEGWMRPNGIVFQTASSKYEHQCTNCNYKQSYSVRYPHSFS